MYPGTFGVGVYIALSACFLPWAVRGSNPRPSRCKQGVPSQNCGFYGHCLNDFPNIVLFRSRFVTPCGTQVHTKRATRSCTSSRLNTER